MSLPERMIIHGSQLIRCTAAMPCPTLQLPFGEEHTASQNIKLGPQAIVLAGYARAQAEDLIAAIRDICHQSPLRHMVTRGGWKMSVAMTNCGRAGWTTDRSGYRYNTEDPETGKPWPPMPALFSTLASKAAAACGFEGFEADACLINQYRVGSRLSLHQDRNERDYRAPIVSVSLGLPAVFLFGGNERTDRPMRVPLTHGDVAVWGGVDRMRFHGILPLKEGLHPLTGDVRYNLTFRKAL